MGAKPQLSPNERLARKRAAARLRQQRCRARKRQAMLEQKRVHQEQMSRSEAIAEPMSTQHAASAFRMRRPTDGDTNSALPTSTQQPIYKVVSFESQRSFEEANNKGQSKSPPDTVVTVSSPPRKTADTSSVTPTESAATPVPDKEAAAIAAMLSLKSSPSTDKKTTTPPPAPRVEMPLREQQRPSRPYGVPTAAKIPLYRGYNNIRYEKARYGMPPHQRMPHYYMGMSHPPPPRPHPQYRYGYPSSYPRFVRYE